MAGDSRHLWAPGSFSLAGSGGAKLSADGSTAEGAEGDEAEANASASSPSAGLPASAAVVGSSVGALAASAGRSGDAASCGCGTPTPASRPSDGCGATGLPPSLARTIAAAALRLNGPAISIDYTPQASKASSLLEDLRTALIWRGRRFALKWTPYGENCRGCFTRKHPLQSGASISNAKRRKSRGEEFHPRDRFSFAHFVRNITVCNGCACDANLGQIYDRRSDVMSAAENKEVIRKMRRPRASNRCSRRWRTMSAGRSSARPGIRT